MRRKRSPSITGIGDFGGFALKLFRQFSFIANTDRPSNGVTVLNYMNSFNIFRKSLRVTEGARPNPISGGRFVRCGVIALCITEGALCPLGMVTMDRASGLCYPFAHCIRSHDQ